MDGEVAIEAARMSVAELVECARRESERDSPIRWEAIGELVRRSNPKVFEATRGLISSGHPRQVLLGADVAARFGLEEATFHNVEDPSFLERSRLQMVAELVTLCSESDDPVLLATAVIGLGNQAVPRSSDAVMAHLGHPAAEVRQAVAYALAPLVAAEPDPASAIRAGMVSALVTLADDPSGEVRNWALFGLGQILDDESEEIREVFTRHLDDPHEEARREAEAGLARLSPAVVMDGLVEGTPAPAQ